MDESEELTALKKAYADMILNSTNEAAIKIMKSDSKVNRNSQFNFTSIKEESIRLLFRFKETMDTKINDLETKSLNQQKKIEELEAELRKSQSIVGYQQFIKMQVRIDELEAQLRKAENVVCTQQIVKLYRQLNDLEMKSQNQQRKIQELEAQLGEAEDIVNDLRGELHVAHTRMEKLEKEQMHCKQNMMENILREKRMAELVKQLPGSVFASQEKGLKNAVNGHHVANNSSTSTGSINPELCRNGCTQRVHAFMGNLLKGHSSLSSKLDDLKNDKTIIKDKEDTRMHMNPPMGANTTYIARKMPVGITKVGYMDKSSHNDQADISLCKKRKISAGYIGLNAPELDLQPVTKEASSSIRNSQTFLSGSHDRLKSLNDKDRNAQSVSPSTTLPIVSVMRSLDDHLKVVQGGGEFPEKHNLVSTRQQSDSRDCLGVRSSNPDTEMKNVSSTNSELIVLDACEGSPSRPQRERVLKYTFQRKCKKDLSEDSNLLSQETSLIRTTGKKQDGNLEPEAESSGDCQRMKPVA